MHLTGEEFLLWSNSASDWSDCAYHNVLDEIDAAFARIIIQSDEKKNAIDSQEKESDETSSSKNSS